MIGSSLRISFVVDMGRVGRSADDHRLRDSFQMKRISPSTMGICPPASPFILFEKQMTQLHHSSFVKHFIKHAWILIAPPLTIALVELLDVTALKGE